MRVELDRFLRRVGAPTLEAYLRRFEEDPVDAFVGRIEWANGSPGDWEADFLLDNLDALREEVLVIVRHRETAPTPAIGSRAPVTVDTETAVPVRGFSPEDAGDVYSFDGHVDILPDPTAWDDLPPKTPTPERRSADAAVPPPPPAAPPPPRPARPAKEDDADPHTILGRRGQLHVSTVPSRPREVAPRIAMARPEAGEPAPAEESPSYGFALEADPAPTQTAPPFSSLHVEAPEFEMTPPSVEIRHDLPPTPLAPTPTQPPANRNSRLALLAVSAAVGASLGFSMVYLLLSPLLR